MATHTRFRRLIERKSIAAAGVFSAAVVGAWFASRPPPALDAGTSAALARVIATARTRPPDASDIRWSREPAQWWPIGECWSAWVAAGEPPDLFRLSVRLTAAGEILAFGPTINVTGTPNAAESILDRDHGRVLHTVRIGDALAAVVERDAAVPERREREVVFADSPSTVAGRIVPNGIDLWLDGTYGVRVRERRLDGGARYGAALVEPAARVPAPTRWVWLEAPQATMAGWLASVSSPDVASDSTPVELRWTAPAGVPFGWRPPRGSGGDGWRALQWPRGSRRAPTFHRIWRGRDEVHVLALDPARFDVGFAPGTSRVHAATGLRGDGRPAPGLGGRVAASWRLPPAAAGIASRRRWLSPPAIGLWTWAFDDRGRFRVGPWPVPMPSPLWNARQFARPIILDGSLARALEAGTANLKPRAALGRGTQGHILVAWSDAATPLAIARALLAADAYWAVPLDGDAHSPLPDRGEQERDPGVDRVVLVWRPDAADRAEAAGMPGHAPVDWSAPPVAHDASVFVGAWSGASAGPSVELWLVDLEVMRVRWVPGYREQRRVDVTARAITVRSAPRVRLPVGLPWPETVADGLIVEAQTWRGSLAGAMTLAIDRQGQAFIGRWGAGASIDGVLGDWYDVRQGPVLVEGGRIADLDLAQLEGTAYAIGRLAADGLVYGRAAVADTRALAQAMVDAGVVDALLVGHDLDDGGAVDVLDTVRYYEIDAAGLIAHDRDGRRLPFESLSATPSSAILVLARADGRR